MEKDEKKVENYLFDIIKSGYKDYGMNLYDTNFNTFQNELNSNRSTIIEEINPLNIESGKFYFMYYDLQGKTSNWEKINPLFVVDYFDMNNTRMVFGVSLNFMPMDQRVVFFNKIVNFNLDIVNKNKTIHVSSQYPFKHSNFYNIYKLLQSVGLEYTIRKFDIKLINKIKVVSTEFIPQFISMSTSKITGVNDNNIIQLWKKKILTQQNRQEEMLKELNNDYNEINKTLTKEYMSLDKKASNIEKSLQLINKNFK